MSLSILPAELLLYIASYITNEKDLNSIVRSCRRVYNTLNDTLYKRHADHSSTSATSALIWAAHQGRHGTARRFLALGADANATGHDRMTSLMLAAVRGHEGIVQLLLTVQGIDVNAQHWIHRKTALHYAAMHGHFGVMRLLVGAPGIDLNISDKSYGGTPLIAMISATKPGNEQAIRILVDEEAIDLNQADEKWELSPLLWAIKDGQTVVACILLEKKIVNVNFADPEGQTALWWAAKLSNERCVQHLLARGDIEANAPNHKGQTPLWVAAKNGHAGVVRMLLRVGADPTMRDNKHYMSALTVAAAKDREDVVCLLIGGAGGIDYTEGDMEHLRAFILRVRDMGHWGTVRLVSKKLGITLVETSQHARG